MSLQADINQMLLDAETPLGLYVLLSRKPTAQRAVETEEKRDPLGKSDSRTLKFSLKHCPSGGRKNVMALADLELRGRSFCSLLQLA